MIIFAETAGLIGNKVKYEQLDELGSFEFEVVSTYIRSRNHGK